jgi:NitT/TauT family transport system ATP-binding protein
VTVAAVRGDLALRIDDVTRVFGSGPGQVHALDNVSLDVARGEFVCFLGASGCGKSTLLSLVAGLDHPSSGTIDVHGHTPVMMFQDAALLPWLTAGENVELPLKIRGVRRAARRKRADELLALVRLAGLAGKRPHELSGGMRQRVSLARAFAQEADLLCMDEPFGALDAMTRDILHDELEQIWRETGVTILFVTHDVREAVRLGDRVVLLSSRPGRIVEVFKVGIEHPRRLDTPAVAELAAAVTSRLRHEVIRHGH